MRIFHAAASVTSKSSSATRSFFSRSFLPLIESTGLSLKVDVTKDNPIMYPYKVVDTVEEMEKACDSLSKAGCIALDIEALCTQDLKKQLGDISLVQACSDAEKTVYLFDALVLPRDKFIATVGNILCSTAVWKLFFDCRRDVEALNSQLGFVPKKVLDLQLYFTAWQWKLRSVHRRSSMGYVLKTVSGATRREEDSVVQTAMTMGNRPVWDVRPLPEHFLEYAAGDVRHILFMTPHLVEKGGTAVDVERVERITAHYVEHYAQAGGMEEELDPSPAEVNIEMLERFIGPGGVCKFCGAAGHTEAECFRKQSNSLRCTFCGALGHSSRNCYKQHPQLLKCESCSQIGHSAANCFKKNPCKYCGGKHKSNSCHKRIEKKKFFDLDAVKK